MAPALVVIGIGLDPTRTLVMSQVVLSFGLPFAIIPLVMFTCRADIMGEMVNKRITTITTSFIAAIIVVLNAYLIYKTAYPG
jgi:manganese transport protein